MAMRNKIASAVLSCVIGMATFAVASPVLASDAGAFIGGVFATKLVGGMRDRNEAEQRQAAASGSVGVTAPPGASANCTASNCPIRCARGNGSQP